MRKIYAVRSRGKTLRLGERTWLMGVINTTPDSFYPGSRAGGVTAAVSLAEGMLRDGADILDVGGESTRPGSQPIGESEEIDRVIPVLEAIRGMTDAVVSIDTYRSAVAREALAAGADLVNDISGLHWDPAMASTVAAFDAAAVVMHVPAGRSMMHAPRNGGDTLADVGSFLVDSLRIAAEAGLGQDRILVDPGIGFGKTLTDNLRILRNLDFLQRLDRPVLVGPSRKSFIGKVLDHEVEDRLWGTAAAVTCAVLAGAHVIRVHDVGPMRSVIRMADALAQMTHA